MRGVPDHDSARRAANGEPWPPRLTGIVHRGRVTVPSVIRSGGVPFRKDSTPKPIPRLPTDCPDIAEFALPATVAHYDVLGIAIRIGDRIAYCRCPDEYTAIAYVTALEPFLTVHEPDARQTTVILDTKRVVVLGYQSIEREVWRALRGEAGEGRHHDG